MSMRESDIQFRINQKRAEIEEKKWWRDHYCERRSEIRKRNAPHAMIRRYDLDILDTIEKINLLNIELADLMDLQLQNS